MKLSQDAKEYLHSLLHAEVSRQVAEGRGDEPMPDKWNELFLLVIE